VLNRKFSFAYFRGNFANFFFAFRSSRKVTKITKVFAKTFAKTKIFAKNEKSEFQEANEVLEVEGCSGPTDPGNVQYQMRKTM
jgi:hypothetical protein